MELIYTFTTMTFAYPWALLIPFILLAVLRLAAKPRDTYLVPSIKFLEQAPRSWRYTVGRPLLGIIAAIVVVFLSIAAARPQRINIVETQVESRNLMLAIDVSPSMGATDFSSEQSFRGLFLQKNRLDGVKHVLSEFMKKRPHDRIGVVVFGGNAYLRSPLTRDYRLLEQILRDLEVGMAGEGTAIGDGLGLSLKRVQEIPQGAKSVILLTDGVNNSGQVNPRKAAQVAADLGIKVHSIGIGSQSPVSISMPGSFIGPRTYPRVEFDEETLKEIARVTGGSYFHASSVEGLGKISEEIDMLEGTLKDDPFRPVAEELFFPSLQVALIFYAAYLLLSTTVLKRFP